MSLTQGAGFPQPELRLAAAADAARATQPTLPSCNVKSRQIRRRMTARARSFGLYPYATLACVACRSACTSRLRLLFSVSRKGTLDSGQNRSRDAAVNNWPVEETNNPLLADDRNFCKVEKWTKDGRVERMLHAGNLGKMPRTSSRRPSSTGRGSD
jgi:hypothetical protein